MFQKKTKTKKNQHSPNYLKKGNFSYGFLFPCPTLSNPMDCSLPGSSVHGNFQAGVLEWGAIACSDSKGKKKFLKEEVNCAL